MAEYNIYLDNAATTAPDPDCIARAAVFLKDKFYNPSALYSGGLAVRKEIENAREEIAAYFPIGRDVIFTSCGSEADDTAIFAFGRRGNVVATAGEHSAVFASYNELKQRGVDVRFAPLNENGSVNVDKFLGLVDASTSFVSVVHVNNETGAINDVNAIAREVKRINPRAIFHSDGVQAFLKINEKPDENVDLYSISAHKIRAVKGTGALVFKKSMRFRPLIYGGGQEKTLRSGTENVFGIMTMLYAFRKYRDVEAFLRHAEAVKRAFIDELDKSIKVLSIGVCSPYIVSISVPRVKAEIMQRLLDAEGITVGTGSACSSRMGASRVLVNCGYDKNITDGVLRVSFIFDTSEDDARICAKEINRCAQKLRNALK